ncbi:NADAR family protein [Streptomyces sp. NPDC048659]|uniref:NADAR family protein n=1 Tax=Streptomyces sp. NPDC048659 TaxID=3155489 RepID=UPI0034171EAF
MKDLEHLIDQVRRGERVKWLHFWGHRPHPTGQLSASCLSQWWPSPFVIDEIHYATAEHWMMAEKARLFGDTAAEQAILSAPTPAQAKNAGRLVRNFEERTWEENRLEIVTTGSVHKFTSTDALRTYLLGTGTRVLVEASPMDRVWGIGMTADDPRAQDPARWRGKNLLGFALMAARERLR